MKTYKIVQIDVGGLKTARFQPKKRIRLERLAGLMSSIAQHGMPIPIAVTEDYTVGDGHRRLACAKELTWSTVPCVVWPGVTAEQIFSILNGHQMSMTPAQWLEAVFLGLSLEQPEIPRPLAKTIQELIDLVDDDTVWQIVEEGKSPDILKHARFVAGKLGWLEDNDGNERVRRIIGWFLRHNTQAMARHAIATGYDDVLAEAIEADEPIKMEIIRGR